MHEYDVALKTVPTRGASGFLTHLIGAPVAKWYNSELPEVSSRRADLLGETVDGRLIRLELQSTNDARMAYRMLKYLVSIVRSFRRVPQQLVLYVGEAPMRMVGRIETEGLSFACGMRDVRELESEPSLASESLDDHMIGILARLVDGKMAVRRLLEKIATGDPERRKVVLLELGILSGLRSLTSTIKEETTLMPILTDFRDNDDYGPIFREIEGKGMVVGRADGERAMLRRLIAKRFRSVPEWVDERVTSLGAEELEALGVRLLDAQSVTELFN